MDRRTEVATRTKKIFTRQSLPPWLLVAFDKIAWLIERGGDMDFIATGGLTFLVFFREWAWAVGVLWLGYLLLRASPPQELSDQGGAKHEGRSPSNPNAVKDNELEDKGAWPHPSDPSKAVLIVGKSALPRLKGERPTVEFSFRVFNAHPASVSVHGNPVGYIRFQSKSGGGSHPEPFDLPPRIERGFQGVAYLEHGSLKISQPLSDNEVAHILQYLVGPERAFDFRALDVSVETDGMGAQRETLRLKLEHADIPAHSWPIQAVSAS